jgi:putative ABC transport system permease protein
MDSLRRDLRTALRQLLRFPGLSLAVVATLAIGLGANTALFAIVDTLLLRPLPLPDAGRLVAVGLRPRAAAGDLPNPLSRPDLEEIGRDAPALQSVAGYRREQVTARMRGEPRPLAALITTPDLVRTVGLRLELGRDLAPADVTPGGIHVALISHALWRGQFGGRPSALGSTLVLDGVPFEVVGVIAPGTPFPLASQPADVILPFGSTPFTHDNFDHRGTYSLRGIARLAPEASVDIARAQVRTSFDRIAARHPDAAVDVGEVVPFRTAVLGKSEEVPLLLLGATAFVLLIACANVSNLLLARALRRRRELAVRAALGATRQDLLRQLIVESVVLAAGAMILALGLCLLLLSFPIPLGPQKAAAVMTEYRIDAKVALFSGLLALAVGVGCGLAAGLLAAPRNLYRSLQEGAAGSDSRSQGRLRALLVVFEVAMAVVLLVGSGLLARTLHRLSQADLGMEPKGLVVQPIDLPATTPDPEALLAMQHLVERVGAVAGVEEVAAIYPSPLSGSGIAIAARTEGSGDQWPETIDLRLTSGGAFHILGIPLRAGRDFRADDLKGHPEVIVVNEALVRKLWPGQSALGKQLALGIDSRGYREVVGVVGDARQEVDASPRPEVYLPLTQIPNPTFDLLLRSKILPGSLQAPLRTAVWSVDPSVPVAAPEGMPARLEQALEARKLAAGLSLGFAAVALLLSAIGIGGLLGNVVTQRMREMGIRRALGARAADLRNLVMGGGLRLVGTGLLVGGVLSVAVGRAIRGFLYGIEPLDPLTYALSGAGLLTVALLASWAPAYRASRVEPTEVMRAE